jgi:hypothetical protein
LAPAFGGLLNDLINQAYRHVAATGKPLDPPLLVVIDEAGNTPLRSLPEYASTLAGLGVLLVTIWQSLAQLEVAYGKASDTILTNHLTKVFYAGLSDPASIQYVDRVLGEAEVDTRSHSAAERVSGGSDQFSTTRVPLAPAHVLRQMRPGDALLVHGTLPPAHVRTRPFYRSAHLAKRAAMGRRRRGGGDVKPFLRATDRARLAPVGWVSEAAGTWAGRQVEVVFDPRQHQIVMVRNEPGDTTRAVLGGEGFRRLAVDGQQEMWVRNRSAEALSRHRVGSCRSTRHRRRFKPRAGDCDVVLGAGRWRG